MKKIVIAVDFDDVVGGFNQAFSTFHNLKFGTNVRYREITDYDMSVIYGADFPTLIKRVEYFCHHHHNTILPVTGAVEFFRSLAEQYELQIVTSRCESLREITEKWLDAKFQSIFTEVHFTNGFVTKYPEKRRTKSSVCQSIGAVALIDDALHYAEDTVNAGIPVLLPNKPWNKGATSAGVIRADSWDDIKIGLNNILATSL